MAHGNPIFHVCKECKQYILNPRFSSTPKWTLCGKISEQITEEKLKILIKLPFMTDLPYSWNWIKY